MGQNIIDHRWPLSPLQQGMLFHHLQEPHAGIDIEQIVIHLREPIDCDRLRDAWRWLVQRHDVLRARVVWDGTEPAALEILPEVVFGWTVEHAEALSDPERHDRLRRFLAADRTIGFVLGQAPLLRLTLFQWQPSSFTLVWTFHHALLDGRTFPRLLREVFDAYAELATGPVAPRPAPPAYSDHLDWLQRANHDAADAFWKEMLADFAAPTPLVVDRRTPDVDTADRCGSAWEIVDAKTTSRLRAVAEQHGLTLSAVVTGAWAILLHRYSGDEDVLFGTTRACRKSSVEQADNTVGLFINTVPVRVAITGGDASLAVLRSIREQSLAVRPYEHTPLARVRSFSQVPAARPLFETLVMFERYRLDAVMRGLGGAWLEREIELHELTSCAITLAAYDGEVLSLKLGFDRRRIEDEPARRMAGHVRQLLEALAANPDATVGELSLVTEAERRQLTQWSSPRQRESRDSLLPADGGANLHRLFERQAALRPDAIALSCDGESLTYAQVNARANRLARALRTRGVGVETVVDCAREIDSGFRAAPDWQGATTAHIPHMQGRSNAASRDAPPGRHCRDHVDSPLVGLYADRSNLLVISILAIVKAGGAYVPLDPAYPRERIAFLLTDAGARLVLAERRRAADLPRTDAVTLCVEDVLDAPALPDDDANLSDEASPDHLAYVIYTSGTTGQPKGSLITHRNVVRLFAATERCYDFSERDAWTLFHSCAFDFSVWELWGALLFGGRLVVVPFDVSRSPDAFRALVERERITVLNQTPSAFRQFIAADQESSSDAGSLRYVILGGEALDMAVLRPWFDRHGDSLPQVVNMYGITETTVHVTHRRLTKADLGSGSVIGTPLADLRLHVLDAQRQPAPLGVPGELYVGGAGLARGYLGRPELTDARFIPDPFAAASGARLYRTGDLARRLSRDDIEYLGRIDNQVKIRGFRIELGEIESALRQHASVRDAAVVALEEASGLKRLVGYVVGNAAAVDASALRAHLLERLPDYMVPASMMFLAAIPLTAHGKLDRRALPAPDPFRPALAARYVEPRTASEQSLAAIWSKVLRIAQVGIHDNFFELGGDSILSIQVTTEARRAGLTLSPALLFSHPTIAALAQLVSAGADVPGEQETVAGTVPLTPIQSWFFEQDLCEAHHYNQAVMLETTAPLDRTILHGALQAMARQHDALQLRYVRGPAGWGQSYGEPDDPLPLTWIDLSSVDEAEQQQRLQVIVTAAHRRFNLEQGPLWRVVHVVLDARGNGRLLFVVHHLAVDGVSWRPLLEDLETAYRQLAEARPVHLPAKTSSYRRWAERLTELARSQALHEEILHWKNVAEPHDGARTTLDVDGDPGQYRAASNTEGGAGTLQVALTPAETRALLQRVPAAYHTQINDVLLTALLRAWTRTNGGRVLVADVEGHGREALFPDLDLSRTVGWFTSIFPVRLELSESDSAPRWAPGRALASVKEQLRRVPRRGVGYGVLRYPGGHATLAQPERPILFNYIGQFDRMLADSSLFRLAGESSGAWHAGGQVRRYHIELNAMTTGGCLELAWRYDQARASRTDMEQLSTGLVDALRELITHCQDAQAFGRSPGDFPLTRLTASELDRLVDTHRDVEDIYPLSPTQTLFLSAGGAATFDQWQGTLHGDLDVACYQGAWQETVRRHDILRSTIHADVASGAVQMVHRDHCLPWTVEDWRAVPSDQHAERWTELLRRDRALPLPIDRLPTMRLALARLTDHTWKLLWSVSALLLDGWSWPLVFRDVSRHYALTTGQEPTPPAHPAQYRDYVEWRNEQSSLAGQRFWGEALAGFREPTPVCGPSSPAAGDSGAVGERYVERAVPISVDAGLALSAAARQAQLTLSILVQGAWALLLSHHTGRSDILFGAACNGRPTELAGAETIVGPFVTNLPVRARVLREGTVLDLLRQLHGRLLELSAFQFTPLVDIQRASEVSWRQRLFDSLVVVQNYAVDSEARRVGELVAIEDFVGPIHTGYPILLLVEPGPPTKLTLIYDRLATSPDTVQRWARDLAVLLEHIPTAVSSKTRVSDLLALLPPAPAAPARDHPVAVSARTVLPPQTDMERTIAAIWQEMFELEHVGRDENVFDLGGTSLLLIQAHQRLRTALGIDFPIVALFEHPTVQALASHLERAVTPAADEGSRWRQRAAHQKQSLGHLRARAKAAQR